jgi:hypothetical protein
MQFVANGPDIPDALLQAHEDGNVVFFCGAGISYPAGLPGFKGLVDDIYKRLGTSLTPIEQDAYYSCRYDATLDLLERRIPGQRIAVRQKLEQALKPKLRRKGATDTHTALLQLARNRDKVLRLVTTNFDRIFEQVARRIKQPHDAFAAPMLPIPKNSRWNGLVYLHGLLPDKPNDSGLHRLIITSGDFGLAYLTERWASRFVSELFRNYVVCFIGYSIEDPVLRYMMDALAADRMLGEITPEAYAFGSCNPGQQADKSIEWEAKGVTPILYEVPTGSHDHSALHSTLKAWAETYQNGILGKERIVVDYALARPSESTVQDDFVGRMLWALSDESGLPAKRFANFNPAPPLEWLEAFSEYRYKHNDLCHFGVSPSADQDDELKFSLIDRPASYRKTPWMALVSARSADSQWDAVMLNLAPWFVRHLNDPELIIWLAEKGGQLSNQFSWFIAQKLDHLSQLQQKSNTRELEEIQAQAPNAIPSSFMKTLWRLFLTGRVKSQWHELNLFRWQERFKHDGLTTTLRLELRDILAPKIILKKPFHWDADEESPEEPTGTKQSVDCELVLADDHVRSSLSDLNNELWQTTLPDLLNDFQQLLRDALDLLRELGEIDDHSDQSHWHLPSVSPHRQNRGSHDWVTLIELLRDAWLETKRQDSPRATRIAQDWFDLPYPTFKRLALFAASHDNCIASEEWTDWLLVENAWWLWDVDTQRETMRLIVLQGKRLTLTAQDRLEAAILAGPPRNMYQKNLQLQSWQELVDHSIWLHLSKLKSSGLTLGKKATDRLVTLSDAHPDLKLAENESDEFSIWLGGTGDPDYEKKRGIDIAPRKRSDLVEWLKQPPPKKHPLYEDTWRDICRTRFFHSLLALCDLSKEEKWPTDRWRVALQVWSEKGMALRSWHYAAPLVQSMPDKVLEENMHSVAWWLMEISQLIDQHETILLDLSKRALEITTKLSLDNKNTDEPISQPVNAAINHPIGYIIQALLKLLLKRKPNDNDRLPADIKPLFTQIFDSRVSPFRHGRVILASRLITLFRVDRPWTEKHLLPLFDWTKNSIETKAAWEGFLWSPRLYLPLLIAFKSQFLETAYHYKELGDHASQFAAFLTYAALASVDNYEAEDFQNALKALPQEGLQEAAQALSQALEGAGDQREDYWRNRAQPFWHNVWPKSRDLITNMIAESLTRLSIAAGSEFPSALEAVQDWLQPIAHPDYVVDRLHESSLCSKFPKDALQLLSRMIDNQQWGPRKLPHCLDAIAKASPELQDDPRYQKLLTYSRQHCSYS